MTTYGIYTSGLAAIGQSVRLDVAANNLANVSTVGFRGDRVSFAGRLVEALEAGEGPGRHYNALVHRHGGAPVLESVRFDRRPGAVDRTGRPLDLALDGEGFFAVRDRRTGEVYHTRAGNFAVGSRGELVTADGRYEVLGRGGAPIVLDPSAPAEPEVKGDGRVLQGDREVGRLALVGFDDPSRLRKHGDALFANRGAAEAPAEARVMQGALETSSVNPLSEMVGMIRALRALESNLEMIRFQDRTLDRSVNGLGRVA